MNSEQEEMRNLLIFEKRWLASVYIANPLSLKSTLGNGESLKKEMCFKKVSFVAEYTPLEYKKLYLKKGSPFHLANTNQLRLLSKVIRLVVEGQIAIQECQYKGAF